MNGNKRESRGDSRISASADLRVAVILSHTLLREGISRLLEEVGVCVEGSFASVEQAVTALTESPPDIVVLGWDSAEITVYTVSDLVQRIPQTMVVVLAGIQMPYDENVMRDMVEAGAAGCLSVDLSPAELVDSLRVLGRGDLVVSREIAWPTTDGTPQSGLKPLPSDLTQREREVLERVAQGATNKEIAHKLEIAESTVKAHLNHILNKLDLRNRQQAAAFAIRYALVSEPP